MVKMIRFAAGLSLGFAITSSVLGQSYVTIDPPGSLFTQVWGLNNRGDIVGLYSKLPTLPAIADYRGFLLHRGKYTLIDFPGATCTSVRRINDRGDMVGFYKTEGCPAASDFELNTHGFLLSKGKFHTIDVLHGSDTQVVGINNRRDMVGVYTRNNTKHGFLLRDGVFHTIDYPGSTSTSAHAINSDGDIVGRYGDSSGPNHAFLLKDNVFSTILTTPGAPMKGNGINNEGDIVGVSGPNAFIRLDDQEVFSLFLFPGSLSTSAQSINERRRVVGTYCTTPPADCGKPGASHGYLRVPARSEDEERAQKFDE